MPDSGSRWRGSRTELTVFHTRHHGARETRAGLALIQGAPGHLLRLHTWPPGLLADGEGWGVAWGRLALAPGSLWPRPILELVLCPGQRLEDERPKPSPARISNLLSPSAWLTFWGAVPTM